jgi:hypothetical protein
MEVVVRVSELVKVVILRMSELVKVAIVIEVVVGVLELVNDVVVLVVTDVTVVCVTVVVVKVVVVEVIVKVLVLVKDAVETVVVLIHHRSTVYAKRWLTLWCIAEQAMVCLWESHPRVHSLEPRILNSYPGAQVAKQDVPVLAPAKVSVTSMPSLRTGQVLAMHIGHWPVIAGLAESEHCKCLGESPSYPGAQLNVQN